MASRTNFFSLAPKSPVCKSTFNDFVRARVTNFCYSSGSGRTGVFCALSIVVERMRTEGVVDLLQTVRQLREQRPQMVETLEEYAFCYEAALQYLSSFDHITA